MCCLMDVYCVHGCTIIHPAPSTPMLLPCVQTGYPLSSFFVRDERLTWGVSRDIVIGLIYLFMLAPLLSVEMLPELPVNHQTFAQIGIQVPKGGA